jgi:Putative auto-transporter adhesin, head GIN domain
MKKLVLSLLIAVSASLCVSAQKEINDPNAQKRNVGSFHGIEVGTGITLTLTEGTTEEVAVSAATPEFRDRIVTEIENGILKIHYDSKLGSVNKRKETKSLKAYVAYKKIDLLHAGTGAEVNINGLLQATDLDMDANTGALIEGQVNIMNLKINQNTGSRINISGKAGKLDIEGNTGSKFVGEEMITTDCSVKVSTGAQVTVRAENALEVKASTGGRVKYKGAASIREIKTNTGGSVTKIKDSK